MHKKVINEMCTVWIVKNAYNMNAFPSMHSQYTQKNTSSTWSHYGFLQGPKDTARIVIIVDK